MNEIVLFETKDQEIRLPVPIEKDTVWLTQDQMSELFATARSSIAYHIGNIFREGELSKDTSVEIFDRSKNKASRPPQYYNLDVIIPCFMRPAEGPGRKASKLTAGKSLLL